LGLWAWVYGFWICWLSANSVVLGTNFRTNQETKTQDHL
jgi:hypothetical protein